MTNKTLLLSLLILGTLPLGAVANESTLDSNVAFYEGENLNYITYPPAGFWMDDSMAIADGYSFAFIPKGELYDTASVIIGVTIFKIEEVSFADALNADTNAIRNHYGQDATILPVDSVFTGSADLIPTFYINDPSQFIPNVMISYYDGGTEIAIFELVITNRVARFEAEEWYLSCLEKFKALPIGDLSAR